MAVYAKLNIQSFIKVEPMIYAYDTPGVTYHDGWIKIGYTNKQTPEQRINQQGGTIDIATRLLWKNLPDIRTTPAKASRTVTSTLFWNLKRESSEKTGIRKRKNGSI